MQQSDGLADGYLPASPAAPCVLLPRVLSVPLCSTTLSPAVFASAAVLQKLCVLKYLRCMHSV